MKTLLVGIMVLIIAGVVLFILYQLRNKEQTDKNEKIAKILAVGYFTLFLIGLLLPDGFIKSVGNNLEE